MFLFALLLLSALLLAWYLRPGPGSQITPTGQSGQVRLNVHGNAFAIPANYIENTKARTGGEMEAVTLVAMFPTWEGYSRQLARQFGNAPDSAVIRVSLRGDPDNLGTRDRLDRVYRPQISGSAPGPFGLTRYDFAPGSSYGNDELFSGEIGKELFLFLCARASPDFPSPNCSAIDRPLPAGLSYAYRFKRAYLGRWREIATGTDSLITRFRRR